MYPEDVFHLHSRLLEQEAKMNEETEDNHCLVLETVAAKLDPDNVRLTVEAARIEGTLTMVQWSVSPGCVGATAIRDWSTVGVVDVSQRGSGVYGQKLPETFRGPFSWAGQLYTERSVLATLLHDVIVSGNEGVLTRGCDVFVPHYDIEVPWYQNLPPPVPPKKPAYWLPAALWMVVLYFANFYSFLFDCRPGSL